jgi:PrcB C-terminal
MNSFVRIASLVLVTTSIACAAPSITGAPGASVPIVRLRADPYAFTFVSGLDKPAQLVVRDAVTWQAIWSQINSPYSALLPLPAVDFSREMIVVVALGSRSTGGYNILITGASEAAGGGTVFTINSDSPGSQCATTQAFTQPVDIARVPLRSGVDRFIEHERVRDCG